MAAIKEDIADFLPIRVPDGSCAVILGFFSRLNTHPEVSLCVDLPEPSPPSKVINLFMGDFSRS